MMLRNSSTPLLSALFSSSSSSFAESPNHHPLRAHLKPTPFPSPTPGRRRHVGLRRVQSEGNLDALAPSPVLSPSGKPVGVPETIPSMAADAPGEEREEDGKVAVSDGWEASLFLARGLVRVEEVVVIRC